MISINIKNIQKTQRNIEKQINELDDSVQRELQQVTIESERNANRRVPVDTGTLRDSITIDLNENSIVADVDYAILVERGTILQAPQPFLRPASVEAFEDGVRRLRDGTRRR